MKLHNPVNHCIRTICTASLILLSACSLNYGNYQDTEAAVPEFTFNDAVFTRYENKKATVTLKADKLEQYKSDSSSFAKNAVFTTWDTDGEKATTEGSCDLLSLDTKNKLYILFNNININLISQNAVITGTILKYNGKTEQVTSDEDSQTTITRDDVTVSGKGFSASGISKSFSFISQTSGIIESKDDDTVQEEALTDETQD